MNVGLYDLIVVIVIYLFNVTSRRPNFTLHHPSTENYTAYSNRKKN